jgi:riboflavin synthase
MRETLLRTSLSTAAPGSAVNLERAVPATGRMGGHLVQGHVDGTGTVRGREHSEHWDVVTVEVPAPLSRYLAPKGSVTVDGVSLTVVDVVDGDRPTFTVSLIPTTLAATTLGVRGAGDPVNIEVDVIAKYVERLLAHPAREDVVR